MKNIQLIEFLMELPEDYEVTIWRPGRGSDGSGNFGGQSPLDSEDIESNDENKTIEIN